jgi:hypothetical protein
VVDRKPDLLQGTLDLMVLKSLWTLLPVRRGCSWVVQRN